MKRITVGILAHVDSGKTTLSEAMLYCSGNISKLGRVDHRDSFLDTFYLERDRGITIFSKQAMLDFKDTCFTLLDTPGHVDFSAETERTLQVLDYAILVISGTDGVQSHTLTLFKLLEKYGVPCFIFVNKTDLDGFDKDVVFNQLKTRLSEKCVEFCESRDEFTENIALCDEALLNSYYENETLSNAEISGAIRQRKAIPCFFGSALKLEGIDEFLEGLYNLTYEESYPNAFGAKVYKISQDEKGNRLTHMKITGGVLKVRDVLQSEKNKDGEKANQIRIYSGEKFTAVDEAAAGTICAVTGISFARSGDGLGFENNSALPVLEPVLTYRVELPEGTDINSALKKMKLLEEEDPQLKVVWDERLKEIQLQLMGDIQLEILKSIIKERFDLEVNFGRGNINYKETIENTVEGVGHFEPLRHYAEVHLILKPKERNSGLTFKTDCKEDLLDKNWQRLILTHLYEKTHIGVLTGSPITDMEITLASGKAHEKHTEGGDFRQATYRAVRHGLRSAKSILLEPIYDFILEVPNDNVGRALSDIQRMSGEFESPEIIGEYTVIRGKAPVSTMSDYTKEVIQYTRGQGKLMCSFGGYDICHNTDEVVEERGYNPDSDIENTADSVFCAHGAGYNVRWDEVKSHMHLQSALSKPKPINTDYQPTAIKSGSEKPKDIYALDKELMELYEKMFGKIEPKNYNQISSFHTKSPKKNETYKRRDTKKFDGEEYLLVDGYNVIFAWDELRELSKDNIDGARNMLIEILSNYQGYKQCEVILVFDAYKVKGNREVEKVSNVNIVYTKEAETADMYIETVTHKLAKNHKVRVVTSDALEQLIILGNGALRVSSRMFYNEIKAAQNEIKSIIDNEY
jgi:small GTP-binding protein